MLAFLLLLQSWEVPVVISGGGLMPEQEKTKTIAGNIYTFDVDCEFWHIKGISIGVAGNVLLKRSRPFENEYMQDPEGSVFFSGYGIGPSFVFDASRILRLGTEYSIYYLMLRYPVAEQSIVTSASANHLTVGMKLHADFMPLSFGRYSIGIKLGMQGLGYGNLDYYSYEEQDVFDQFSVSGLFAQITIARL